MRSEPTQQRSRQTVRRALDAANDEFGEHGFHAAQITRIARRAGISVGALYRFFPDKAALAAALSDQYLDEVADGYRTVLADVTAAADILPAFVRILDLVAGLQVDHAGYYRLTSDRNPDDEASWGYAVRQRMVADFSDVARGVGCDAEPDLEFVLRFAIEQVRSVLATLATDGAERSVTLAHVERLVGLYLADRLDLDPRALDGPR